MAKTPRLQAGASKTDRFWAKVNRNGPTVRSELGPCWAWLGAISTNGYGTLSVREGTKRFSVTAHRLSWEIAHGPAGELFVLHRCDNRGCVNPTHLFLGSQHDNVQDCKTKNRNAHSERNGAARLSADQVREIRELYASGGLTQESLAGRFGVKRESVRDIIHRKNWAYVS